MQENIEKDFCKNKDEIDLIELFRKIWDGRKIVYKSLAVFFVLALIIIIGTPKEYKSEVTLLVESNGNSSGMSGLLQQFGGLAGIKLGETGVSVFDPFLYPNVVKSTPFLLELKGQKITESKYDSTLFVEQYLRRYLHSSLTSVILGYTIGLPGKIIGWIKGKPKNLSNNQKINNNLKQFKVSDEESVTCAILSDRVKATRGETEEILIISVEMQDPAVAAQIADLAYKSLTKYVVDYRTQKVKTDLEFIEARHSEIKDRYLLAQLNLASFRDQNKNVILATSKTEEQRLEFEFTLASNLYTSVTQQLEQAKIKLQERTPVFKVIEPAKEPLQKNKPKTSLILVSMLLLGGFVGIGIIFFRKIKFI